MALQIQKKFIGNDQVDGEKISLSLGQSIKAKDSSGIEQDLIKLGVSDEVLVKGQEVALKATVDAIDARLVTAESDVNILQFDLDAAELAISNEVMRATGVEGGIDSRLITAEGEINILQFDLDAAELAISNEVMRATGVEGGIDSRLITAEGEINVLQFDLDANELALANEIMRATGVEGGIDSRLVTAEGEINVLQFDLDAAELAISNEVMRATGVEGGLQSQIDAISGGGSGSLSALQAEVDATQVGVGLDASGGYVVPVLANYINSTVSIYSAVTTLDAEIKTVSDGLASEVINRAADVDAEESARIAADGVLQGEIDAAEGRLDTAEATLLVKADLVGGLVPAEQLPSYVDDVLEYADLAAFPATGEAGKIYVAVDTSKVYRWSGTVYIQITSGAVDTVNGQNGIVVLDAGDINMVSAPGTTVEAKLVSLQDEIDAEEITRASADTALQGEIDAEEIARAAADVTLQTNINSEAATRLAADNALDIRVDALEAVAWFKESFAISDSQTSVTFTHAPKSNSVVAFVDRLAIHQSSDYSVSGTTMTFMGDLVAPGQSELGNGDTVYVTYQYVIV